MTSTHGISIAALLVTLSVPARSGGGETAPDVDGEEGPWGRYDLDSLWNDRAIADIIDTDNGQHASPIMQRIREN